MGGKVDWDKVGDGQGETSQPTPALAPQTPQDALREPEPGVHDLPPNADAHELLAGALGVKEPFPWQLALLDRLLRGDCPRALDIPTGLGKTAVMAIWLVARACGANLPRRLVYIVDRRAVVDQATRVAEQLRAWVEANNRVKRALHLDASQHLRISTLRGQFADNREWLADPSATAIVVGTVDMIGSRLLFEGYGVSRKMRPYHAGLLGADTLLVLDEAHLVPPFESLLESITERSQTFGPREPTLAALLPRPRLLSLSATGKQTEGTFRLTPLDESHAVVRKRLDAKKKTWVRNALDTDETPLASALAEEAWRLSGKGTSPARLIIFCNARKDAQAVRDELTAKAKKAGVSIDRDLFVGGRRVHERDLAAKWLGERGYLAGTSGKPSLASFLVATSAGEVGVDLDADHMVSDVVAWERMVQRLGRVNRRGDGEATVVIIPAQPTKKERAIQEAAPEDRKPDERSTAARLAVADACLRAVQMLPRVEDALDASPGAFRSLKQRAAEDAALRELLAAASTPAPLHPALSRALVESWSMTSLEHHSGRPEVEPWIRGWVDSDPQTTILWRSYLPVNEAGSPLSKKEVEAYFEAAPPHLLEQLETESYHALDWLLSRLDSLPKRGEPASSDAACRDADAALKLWRDCVVGFLQARDGTVTAIRGDLLDRHPRGPKAARDQLDRDLKGSTLVVDARLGGLTEGLLDDASDARVDDVGEARADLPFRTRVANAAAQPQDADWFEELRLVTSATAEGEPTHWLVIERPKRQLANTEEGRSTSKAQSLAEHQSWAEREAAAIATRLGLPTPFDEMLAAAARLHDEGKQAARWQRAFNAPKGNVYAKTVSRPNIALLDGYRHELGSLPYAAKDPQVRQMDAPLRDLCLHLIAAHHGFARPVIRTDGCEDAPPGALTERAQEIAFRFSNLEERWGPWGLAWWEALLRASDQEASRKNDERPGGDHG